MGSHKKLKEEQNNFFEKRSKCFNKKKKAAGKKGDKEVAAFKNKLTTVVTNKTKKSLGDLKKCTDTNKKKVTQLVKEFEDCLTGTEKASEESTLSELLKKVQQETKRQKRATKKYCTNKKKQGNSLVRDASTAATKASNKNTRLSNKCVKDGLEYVKLAGDELVKIMIAVLGSLGASYTGYLPSGYSRGD